MINAAMAAQTRTTIAAIFAFERLDFGGFSGSSFSGAVDQASGASRGAVGYRFIGE
jgi:hypothetical protein